MDSKLLEECRKILEFWKLEEYFTPVDSPKLLLAINEDGKEIPFDRYYNGQGENNLPLDAYKEYNEKHTKKNSMESKLFNRANLYCGCYKINSFLYKMAQVCELDLEKYEELNEISGEFYIFSVQIDLDGVITEEGFRISPFFYAILNIIKRKGIDADIRQVHIKELDENINDILKQKDYKILKFTDVDQIKKILFDNIEINSDEEIGLESYSNIKYACKGLRVEDESDYFKSFYLKDIETIQKHFIENENIIKYINALLGEENKIMIDTNVEKMKEWLSAECFPLAKYPSTFSPTLMQQIAINIATSEKNRNRDIFSVNGPPGTGKTTLLKEIIASNVEKLAERLIANGISGENFISHQIASTSTSNYNEKYYEIPKDISKYGILVVSNNNGAVENITLDLPKAKELKSEKTLSGYFDREKFDEIYFSRVADELIGESKEAWGLISARMGRKSYINDVLKNCIFAKKNDTEDKISLDLDKEKSISFEQATENYTKAKEKVLTIREEIKKDQKYLEDFYEEKNKLSDKKAALKFLKGNKDVTESDILKFKEQINELEKNIEEKKENLSFFKKILILLGIGKKGKDVLDLKRDISEKLLKIKEKEEELKSLEGEIEKETESLLEIESSFNEKKDAIYHNEDAIKNKYGSCFADNEFFESIEGAEESQNACPWTFREYDKAREELFYHALQVRKAFILESPYIKRNLFLYDAYNNGKFTIEEKKEMFPHLINALSIVIPVLSSTFASVGRFLKYAGNKSLGMLIIDEAGQAVPQSALGALYRTNNAVVVGDPLQIDPVVKIPKVVIDLLADSMGVAEEYKNIDNSVQLFADRVNEFNGKLGERIVGCPLVVHRRCIDPMFSISNMISYDNRMFNKTSNRSFYHNEEYPFLIKKSCWFDVKGEEIGGKNHFVKNQAEKVCELIEKAAISNKEFFNEYDKVFIITPFRSVSNSMREYLINYFIEKNVSAEKLKEWSENCIGTVHTFQGKDADEVLFMLGCSNKSIGAMKWVASKANILNVACTRARYRFAFIGNKKDWEYRKYFIDIISKFFNED